MENTIMKFGNWAVTETGLKRTLFPSYGIGSFDLWKVREINEEFYWEWLLHMTEKSWMSKDELQNFNLAFLFAQDYFGDAKGKQIAVLNVSLAKCLYLQQQLKANEDRVYEIESPENGLSMPPDDLTTAYQKKVQDVIVPITYLELPA